MYTYICSNSILLYHFDVSLHDRATDSLDGRSREELCGHRIDRVGQVGPHLGPAAIFAFKVELENDLET